MFVIGLIILVVGVSYAAYRFSGTGTTENVITTGNLEVSFAEQNNILIKDRYPETDTEGLANTDEDSSMSFTVSSNIVGNATVNYAVGLVEIKEGTTLTQDYIKINLTKNGSAANGFTTTTGKTIRSFENISFSDLITSHVITQGSITGTQVDTYTLKAWIDESYDLPKTDTSSGNSHSVTTTSEEFSFKIKVAGTDATQNEEEEPNIPNAPELATNMIPVTYDSEHDTWVKADSTNSNNSWYNYDNKVWANAVTVTSTNRQTYLDATAGTPISMDDINTMWVWIPRFSATIPVLDCSIVVGTTYEEYPMCYNIILTDNQQTTIMEVFELDEESFQRLLDGEIISGLNLADVIELYNTVINPENKIVPEYEFDSTRQTTYQGAKIDFTGISETSHDAFTFGDDAISGFWMAKFEPSHVILSESTTENNLSCVNDTCENAKGIEILPNKVSLGRNNVSNMFYASRSLEQTGNLCGLVSNEIDTHMMKNNEWGAVAYLTYSEFGRCTDDYVCSNMSLNNNSNSLTGYGAPSGSDTSVANGAYNTDLGMDASTTGNIYGVYDMKGGAREYVMGVYTDGNKLWSGETSYYNSGFNGCIGETCSSEKLDGLAFPNEKYYNTYTTPETYEILGLQHALTETAGWYGSAADFVFSSSPWLERGGDMLDSVLSGVFFYTGGTGSGHKLASFRPVLIK